MTFTQLEIFALVAELRGFTAAAAKLAISQSAVSHALKGLERELGVELLVRQQSSVELTEIGRQLLLRTREILGLSEAMRQDVADARGQRRGTLRIGSFGPTSSLKLLPAILDAYQRRYPGIEVRVDEGADHEVTQWILDRRVDVGFVVLPEERFHTVPLVQDQMMALLPRAHPLAGRAAVTLAELCETPFIMSEAGCAALIEPLFTTAGLTPQVRYRIAQVITILGMVERGIGVSIVAELALPDRLARNYPELVKLPLAPAVTRRVGLAVRALHQSSPATLAFLDIAQASAPQPGTDHDFRAIFPNVIGKMG
ncbi:LysR family transcriptional regulator [Janthinobacterium fluminis]|uniref:LysR substrate-binding domain-containing protein n=1 Tax=Janthinobacterium fluminis TaxID=2987524 RepID=A0ABT5JWK5_9BURK|nr:LysR family transcriptional regulator [Janthinobacterium fluminis]MDC8756446.1 LysR substrate-binding domain-containing protein [Janthinobacterium fluminis]